MATQTVILDANVLYGNFLRDLLLSLFASRLYDAKWTDTINGEWVEHLLERKPHLERKSVERTVQLMNKIEPCGLVAVTEFEALINGLDLPDKNDRHVLAAAIASKASKIVTWNLKDFPVSILKGFGIVAENPDRFLEGLLQENPNAVITVFRDMRKRLRKPPMDVSAFFDALENNKLTKTRKLLEPYKSML